MKVSLLFAGRGACCARPAELRCGSGPVDSGRHRQEPVHDAGHGHSGWSRSKTDASGWCPSDRGQGVRFHGGSGPCAVPCRGRTTADPPAGRGNPRIIVPADRTPGRSRGRRRSDIPHVQRRPVHRRTSIEPWRQELLQALGTFQRATADQLWKLTCPGNRHDRLTRDNRERGSFWSGRAYGSRRCASMSTTRTPGNCSAPATATMPRRSPRPPPNSTVPGTGTRSPSRRRSPTGSQAATLSGPTS